MTGNETHPELGNLGEAIALGQGFQFYILGCDQPEALRPTLQALEAEVMARSGEDVCLEVLSPYAEGEAPPTFEQIIERVVEPLYSGEPFAKAQGKLIVAVDATRVSYADELGWHRAFRRMNEVRNTISRRVPGTLVLCIPARLEEAFAFNAPDFWSIRSRNMAIAAAPELEEGLHLSDEDASGDERMAKGMPAMEAAPDAVEARPMVPGQSRAAWPELTILHISAPLFIERAGTLYMWNAFEASLKREVRQRGKSPDLICVSGDIAFSGRAVEYENARYHFLGFPGRLGISSKRLLFVPGVHDFDQAVLGHELKQTWRTRSVATQIDVPEELERIMQSRRESANFLRALRCYQEFDHRFHRTSAVGDERALYWTRILDIGGVRVGIAGLNSAWWQPYDEQGAAVLGAMQIREALARLEGIELRIALLHHSPRSLRDWSRIEPYMRQFDLVLHGSGQGDATVEALDGGRPALVGAPPFDVSGKLAKDAGYVLVVLGQQPRVVVLERHDGAWSGSPRELPLPP